MPVRSTMSNLIARVRIMTNDTLPAGSGQIFSDQTIQDVMDDGSRTDTNYLPLTPYATYSGSSITYLDYYAEPDNWEDSPKLYQYRTTLVTPSVSEPIIGHWQFAATTLPPVFIVGSYYDMYRAAADLLERWAAQWLLSYDLVVDGQNLRRSQVAPALQARAKDYRMKQKLSVITLNRSDIAAGQGSGPSLRPRPIDYYGSGDGR